MSHRKEELLTLQRRRCNICASGLTLNQGQVDHKVPRSLTHDDSDVNLQVICANCHATKTKLDIKDIRVGKKRARDIEMHLTLLDEVINMVESGDHPVDGDVQTHVALLLESIEHAKESTIKLHTGKRIRVEDILRRAPAIVPSSKCITCREAQSTWAIVPTLDFSTNPKAQYCKPCAKRATEGIPHMRAIYSLRKQRPTIKRAILAHFRQAGRVVIFRGRCIMQDADGCKSTRLGRHAKHRIVYCNDVSVAPTGKLVCEDRACIDKALDILPPQFGIDTGGETPERGRAEIEETDSY